MKCILFIFIRIDFATANKKENFRGKKREKMRRNNSFILNWTITHELWIVDNFHNVESFAIT